MHGSPTISWDEWAGKAAHRPDLFRTLPSEKEQMMPARRMHAPKHSHFVAETERSQAALNQPEHPTLITPVDPGKRKRLAVLLSGKFS
jgi:hypothetical protein